MKVWQCSICRYIHRGDKPPEKCPVCGVGANKFVEIDEASIPEKTPGGRMPLGKKPMGEKPMGKKSGPGSIKKEEDVQTGFEKIKSLLVKHHAHPVLVHTPNGILPAAVILLVAAWMFDYDLLAKAAFINMIFVILAFPLVIFTGILEWKQKFNGAMTMIFKLKIIAAALTTITCIISFVWYLIDPMVLSSPNAWIFLLINILMLLSAGIAGHIGGKLVYKD